SGRSGADMDEHLAVSNLYDGFDLYDIETGAHVHTYTTALPVNVPLPVVVTSDGSELITGSAYGKVEVFNPASHERLQRLDHNGQFEDIPITISHSPLLWQTKSYRP
ncbi:hypothetical protein FKP32DRAFT_1579130, partial [Trametes sanguinea]